MTKQFDKYGIIFLQSEGRGHITQAMALQEILNQQNIGVSALVIRRTTRKTAIQFLKKRFHCEFLFIESYEFFKGKNGKSVNLLHTGIDALLKLPKILISIFKLRKTLKKIPYDIIFNFYEPACTFYNLFFREQQKTISIAHQNSYLHPDFRFPKKHFFNALFLKYYTKLTAALSAYKIALSFYPLSNLSKTNLVVTGPLLRNKLKDLDTSDDNFILVYLAYNNYLEDIIQWHNKHQDISIHCFTDKKGVAGTEALNDKFFVHSIDENSFLQYLSKCSGVVTTAGFESVCEALYLDKSVMMVPIANHFEQHCNAIDAQKVEAGIAAAHYDISQLLNYLTTLSKDKKNNNFRTFTDQSEHIIINIVRLILYKEKKISVNLEANTRKIHAQNSLRH
jgi:uncharacterized protein (TIGR00661 family)